MVLLLPVRTPRTDGAVLLLLLSFCLRALLLPACLPACGDDDAGIVDGDTFTLPCGDAVLRACPAVVAVRCRWYLLRWYDVPVMMTCYIDDVVTYYMT